MKGREGWRNCFSFSCSQGQSNCRPGAVGGLGAVSGSLCQASAALPLGIHLKSEEGIEI